MRSIAFPKLGEAELASLGRCPLTVLKRYRAGETLFEIGDRDCKFFVIKSGEVEIVDESGDAPKTVAVHGPGEFTGEVAQLTGSPALVSAVARGDCEVYEVSPDALRQVLNHHPELGDIDPAGLHCPPATAPRAGELHRPARDRLALLAGHLPDPRFPGQEPGCRSPGSTWRPTRR